MQQSKITCVLLNYTKKGIYNNNTVVYAEGSYWGLSDMTECLRSTSVVVNVEYETYETGGYFDHFHTGMCRLGAQTQPCLKFFGTQKYYPV